MAIYAAGSSALTSAVQSPSVAPGPLQVEASRDTTLFYLINPMRFSMTPTTTVEVQSSAVWTLNVSLTDLPAANWVSYESVSGVAKPKAP